MIPFKKIITTFIGLSAFVLPVSSFAAQAVDSAYVGVIRNESKNFKIFSALNGNALTTQTLSQVVPQLQRYYKYFDLNVADIRSNTGVEWLTYNDADADGDVLIYDQLGNQVDSFAAFSDNTQFVATAIGELSAEFSGPEIALCNQSSTIPRLKVFSYSEIQGATQLLSIKPYGEGDSESRGCGSVAIGDVDGDGMNEIVMIKMSHNGSSAVVDMYSMIGEKLNSFSLPSNVYSWYQSALYPDYQSKIKIFVQDINGDDTAEIIFQGDSKNVYAYDKDGGQLYVFSSTGYNEKEIQKIDVGDINNDGIAEVIIQQTGRKLPIVVLNQDGLAETFYKLSPNSTTKTKSYIYLGDFSIN